MKTNIFLKVMLLIEYQCPEALQAAEEFGVESLQQVQFNREFITFLAQRLEASRISEARIQEPSRIAA